MKTLYLFIIAIKIKCSNNALYRVFPVYTCLAPGNAKRLQVVRDPGEARADKLILLYRKTKCKNARDAFQSDSGIGHDEEESPQTEIKKRLIALVAKGPLVHTIDTLTENVTAAGVPNNPLYELANQ
ncbi:MSP (Major sperm protein) domain-containing protein [Ditylenchus destructor]|uniref:Major sperm protein n=1 Tax=Ditylenchus destructor TaxID=166010 RepID=A0AAD4N6I4_9BILA|nr:MSP (Major sperm protein) domain-containing protein [Ditylenchus destructor]